MSMKYSNDTIGNRTRDLPACNTVPQPTAPPRAPKSCIGAINLVFPWRFYAVVLSFRDYLPCRYVLPLVGFGSCHESAYRVWNDMLWGNAVYCLHALVWHRNGILICKCMLLVLQWYVNLTVCTRVGTLIVSTIYLQLIQNRYMFQSFTVLQCSHQHCVQPVASDVEVVGYL